MGGNYLSRRAAFVSFLAAGAAVQAATIRVAGNLTARFNASPQPDIALDGDDDFDPSDLSYITKLAAIGDSYSAGIGAGDRLGSVFSALDPQSGS